MLKLLGGTGRTAGPTGARSGWGRPSDPCNKMRAFQNRIWSSDTLLLLYTEGAKLSTNLKLLVEALIILSQISVLKQSVLFFLLLFGQADPELVDTSEAA